MGSKKKLWLMYAVTAMLFWGVWGAFTGLPAENGFPDTLIYCVWAITMIIPALFVLQRSGWKIETDSRSIYYGMIIGLLGAGGQMILFYAVTIGPTYLIFPIISLSPIVTIALSIVMLKERTGLWGGLGIVLALISLPLFEYGGDELAGNNSGHGSLWFILALLVLLAWGVQAYFMKLANNSMGAESIFFYMTVTGLILIPVALGMTDFSQEINWGFKGPYMTAIIQVLNAIGALFLVYAFRYGKAIVVSPLTNAGAPLMTAIISLLFLGMVPGIFKIGGILLALAAAFLLARSSEE
ncbi:MULTISPECIES: EamA family transporter [Flavobacteriaceae]|uniref:EamA family transporter n=1 Tax=Flavobacteriaceae TaxID=49546 RepID=UPI0014925833|nr:MULTISPECIES: EamA family transporter [Allomuricauda]MDC6366814.1 EamA family transporter [Muricauda sp. AC10]